MSFAAELCVFVGLVLAGGLALWQNKLSDPPKPKNKSPGNKSRFR